MSYRFDFRPVWAAIDQLLWGAWLTIQLTAVSCLLGLVIAIVCVAARMRGNRIATGIVTLYIELFRNTPLLVQLFFIFFALPMAGIRMGPTEAAILAMTANVGAYAAEILRSGVESVPKGLSEAGFALGLRPLQIFSRIILPPAMKAIYPALASQFILLLLASSLVSAISATDLTAAANTLQSYNARSFEVYFLVAGMYLVLCIGFRALFGAIYHLAFRRKGAW